MPITARMYMRTTSRWTGAKPLSGTISRVKRNTVAGRSMKMPIMARVMRWGRIQRKVRTVSTAARIQTKRPPVRSFMRIMSNTSIPIVSHSNAVQNQATAVKTAATASELFLFSIGVNGGGKRS